MSSKPQSQQTIKGRPVLVTTAHRGVFFGYLLGEPSKEKVLLSAARNVTFWDVDTHGFLGLAGNGPTKKCRISPAAGDESTVYDVTGVFACTDVAAKAFEAEPWAK